MKMLVGLTGKTGSGKTSAAKILTSLGAFVADCDEIAHDVLKDSLIKEKLCKSFSYEILDENNDIDRKALGRIVFSDDKKLKLLNSIVHGAIIEKALSMCNDSKKDICFIDGSELQSSGIDKKCDHIVVITADESVRLDRIQKRDNIDREGALLRMRAQKDYTGKAIFVENNDGYAALESAVTDVYKKFLGEINV